MENTQKIYVLLIRSKSFISRTIRLFTRAGYTHASLGFSEDCMQLYSFARKYERLPIPGKMMEEKIDRGFLGKDPKTPCALYCIEVSEKIYEETLAETLKMYNEGKKYRYNYFGLVYCLFGKEKQRKNRFFCSEFVAHSLKKSGAMDLEKHPSLFRPVDFQKNSQLKLVYEGNIGGLRSRILCSN